MSRKDRQRQERSLRRRAESRQRLETELREIREASTREIGWAPRSAGPTLVLLGLVAGLAMAWKWKTGEGA